MAIAKRKKKFWNVEIPCIKKETQLYGFSLEELEGRLINYDLTRMLKGKASLLQAVVKISEGKAIAFARQIKLLPYYTKRMVRKGTNYVEDSFETETQDAIVRIKPFLVTRRKVSRAVRKALRNKAKEELIAYAKGNNSQDIAEDILNNNLQKQLSLTLKKIYPLSTCEIRVFKIEKILKEIKPREKETKLDKKIDQDIKATSETKTEKKMPVKKKLSTSKAKAETKKSAPIQKEADKAEKN